MKKLAISLFLSACGCGAIPLDGPPVARDAEPSVAVAPVTDHSITATEADKPCRAPSVVTCDSHAQNAARTACAGRCGDGSDRAVCLRCLLFEYERALAECECRP